MTRYISENDVAHLAKDFVFENAIFYLNDFEMPRTSASGEIVFEEYGTPDFAIAREGNDIVLSAPLSGYRTSEVTVSIEDNILTIAGKRKIGADTEMNIKEYGSFYREMYVPRSVDQKKIRVTFTDGIFKIYMPKAKREKLRVLKIN